MMSTTPIETHNINDQGEQARISTNWATSIEEVYSHQWQMKRGSKLKHKQKEHKDKSEKVLATEKSDINTLTPLPITFRPGPYDVICGRGKDVLQHPGNRRYRELINSSLRNYVATSSKLEKTLLVTSIIKLVEDACSRSGGFIKKVNGAWYKVSESYAREKCGQSIRDALHTEYRSSSRAKAGRRKLMSKQLNNAQSDSSTMGSTARSQINERIGVPTDNVFWERLIDPDEDEGPDYEEKSKNFVNAMNIKLIPDTIQLNLLSNELIQSNDLHLRKPNMLLSGIGEDAKNIANYCSSSNIIEKSTLVSVFEDHLAQTSKDSFFGFNPISGATNDYNKIMLKSKEMEDPEGLDWMIQSMIWDD